MYSIGKDKAIRLAETKWWKEKTPKEICDIQLFTKELCMDFSDFHAAMETCLSRPIFTHEFGLNLKGIVDDYIKKYTMPSQSYVLINIDSMVYIDKS